MADAARRRLAARIGGISCHLRYGSDKIAARARAGLETRFEREADPEGILDPEERARRVALIRKLYFTRIALARAKAAEKPPGPASNKR